MDTRLKSKFYHDSPYQSSGSDSEVEPCLTKKVTSKPIEDHNEENKRIGQNIITKLYNRERTGYFSHDFRKKVKQSAFKKVPNRLAFCLKDIVPFCYLDGHVFMGLTACGQFLLSYKVSYDEESENDYSFSRAYKYELYFWIYKPHCMLVNYYRVCLFDDHGVDNMKNVSMTQWLTNPRVLIIHGASEIENEDSYITIASVPKLGCRDCLEIRIDESDEYYRSDTLCIKCNLTIHTKYGQTDSDPKFVPRVNLNCPERIVMVANGYIHMMHVKLEMFKPTKTYSDCIDMAYMKQIYSKHISYLENIVNADDKVGNQIKMSPKSNKQHSQIFHDKKENASNIVAKIIADFAECETETMPLEKTMVFSRIDKSVLSDNKNFDELIITCGSGNCSTDSTSNKNLIRSNVSLLSHQNGTSLNVRRLYCKSNKITTIDLQNGSPTSNQSSATSPIGDKQNFDIAAKAYEFSEDNEKCEKIGIFRKRRLADKKYEFSEDNSENIIPFNRLRSAMYKSLSLRSNIANSRAASLSPSQNININPTSGIFSSSPPNYEVTSHLHRASPSHGFRSPCGSPVGNRCLKSPPGFSRTQCLYPRSPTYTKSFNMIMTSPRQLSKKAMSTSTYSSSMTSKDVRESQTNLFMSPRREENLMTDIGLTKIDLNVPIPLTTQSSFCSAGDGGSGQQTTMNSKPICSKKFVRRFVEEDDAASVITSEEDDCISPGYHTSLPMEVHGSCYSDMQMISQTSYQKLQCPAVIITQNSFDLETFTYHIANHLCQANNKQYGVFYDWSCELVNICPLSGILTCVLMAHFTAREKNVMSSSSTSTANCINCSSNMDCVIHRKHFQCCTLFTWNTESGDWDVLDYGQLNEVSPITGNKKHSGELSIVVKKLINELTSSFPKNNFDCFQHLRILDSCNEKSKNSLKDTQNCIEFYRNGGKRHQQLTEFSDFHHYIDDDEENYNYDDNDTDEENF